MILSQLQSECGRLLSDPNNDRWPAATLLTLINLAQTEIQGLTDAVKTSELLTPVVSTRTISVNSATMDIIRMSKTLTDGSIRPFQGVSREELDFMYPDWQQWADGEPLYWWYDATNRNINLVPKPSAAFAVANALTAWESRVPAALVAGTDVPFDANNQMIPYHMAIVHWVVSYCLMEDGTGDALTKAKFHKSGNILQPGQYELQIGRIQAEFDAPEAVPAHILFKPQGGRVGGWGFPSKSQPLTF